MDVKAVQSNWNNLSTGKKAAIIGTGVAAVAAGVTAVAYGKGNNILVKNGKAIIDNADKFEKLTEEQQAGIGTKIAKKVGEFKISDKVQKKAEDAVQKSMESGKVVEPAYTFLDKVTTGFKNFTKGTNLNKFINKEIKAAGESTQKVAEAAADAVEDAAEHVEANA